MTETSTSIPFVVPSVGPEESEAATAAICSGHLPETGQSPRESKLYFVR